MAQSGTTFEEFFSPDRHAAGEPVRQARWWTSWESCLTFTLILLAQLPVIGSLQSSDWVAEMPSLVTVAMFGVVTGWLLAQSRLHSSIAVVIGMTVGVVVTLGLVLQRVPITDPTLGKGWWGRWAEFVLRMQAWGSALWNAAISTDPLPFVVLLVALVYVVVFLSCWAVVRWQNAWVALIPGGIILLTNISYLPGQPSIGFIVFLFASVLLVTRMEFLRAGARWRREHVKLPSFMSLEVMFVGLLVAIVLVTAAWVIPTANHWGPVARVWDRALEPVTSRVEAFGQLFIGINSKREVPIHTFGATLPLQGKVALGSTPLFKVSSTAPGNLRGAVYDEYTGGGWKLSAAAPVPLSGTTVQAAEFGTQKTKAEVRQPVTAKIEVVGAGAPDRRLLSVGDPMTADVPGRQLIDPGALPLGVIPNDPAAAGTTYTTVGTVSAAAVPTLLNSGTSYPPAIVATYTELPATLPPEVMELARQVAGNSRTPYEAARRIEQHLRRNYTYTLAPPAAPARRDAVAAFLFDQRAGYFDQFSSAMAVMLRSLGIPARVATGFVLDENDVDSVTKQYTVTEQRAWAWPEVYFPTLGWVEFNPTPSRPTVARPGDDASALAEADAARAVSGEDDIPFDLFPDDFIPEDEFDAGFTLEQSFLDTRAGQILVQVVSTLLVLSVVALVLAVVARLLWDRHFRGLSPSAARWGKVQRLASWAGIAPPDYLTPSEAAEVVGSATGEVTGMRSLARAYTHARYGRPGEHAESEDEQTQRLADRDYRRVRDQLRSRIVSRLLHAGRVPPDRLPGRYTAARVTGR
ncbi:MAG: transglutaminase domain-containing protein [Chloroflexi bacterium]|nr:transglutaminase domain-containing protein [Chloroflexota bacterium]